MTGASARSVLITGASSGIGAALARRMAGPGTSLLLHARKSKEALAAVAAGAAAKGATVVEVLGDLAQEGVAEDLVKRATGAFGALDVVVANAGFPLFQSFAQGTAADIDYAFRGNLYYVFALAKAAQPWLSRSENGRLVAVGSFTAHVFRTDMQQFPMSAASKGAVETAVRSLAIALAPDRITVNCVVPGHIAKDKAEVRTPEQVATIERQVPLGRLGRPDDVAAVIEFLASPAASYVTGQAIHVNGGLI